MALKITVCGRMRSGKNALADYATSQYGFQQFAFGDDLKKHFYYLFSSYVFAGKPRAHLQRYGQMMREFQSTIWIDKCFEKIAVAEAQTRPREFRVIITDCRQPDEYERCRAEGYTIIGVVCDETTRIERILAKGDAFNSDDLRHETEMHVDDFVCDYYIDNNGTVDELKAQFDAVMAELIEKGRD